MSLSKDFSSISLVLPLLSLVNHTLISGTHTNDPMMLVAAGSYDLGLKGYTHDEVSIRTKKHTLETHVSLDAIIKITDCII